MAQTETKHSESKESSETDALDTNVIIQINKLKKQKQHNGKYALIVQHKLDTMSARYRIRLLEDDEANKPTPKTMIFDSFGMNNDSKQQ
eukprot:903346_1